MSEGEGYNQEAHIERLQQDILTCKLEVLREINFVLMEEQKLGVFFGIHDLPKIKQRREIRELRDVKKAGSNVELTSSALTAPKPE